MRERRGPSQQSAKSRSAPQASSRTPEALGLARVQMVPVERIRPEEGLGRQRDRSGHQELCQSIQKFGVLTPITVRRAPDGSGEYLLVKGQGRTLACRLLGLPEIPAIVVDDAFAETEKVQQFLVENVARLRMRPIDRALLVAKARDKGEETAAIARRFGISAATVRRLQTQLGGASSSEIAALKSGSMSLALHAVIVRHVDVEERPKVVQSIVRHGLHAQEVDSILTAVGWRALSGLGPRHRLQRLRLLDWICSRLSTLPNGSIRERLERLALQMPLSLDERSEEAVQ